MPDDAYFDMLKRIRHSVEEAVIETRIQRRIGDQGGGARQVGVAAARAALTHVANYIYIEGRKQSSPEYQILYDIRAAGADSLLDQIAEDICKGLIEGD